MEDRKQILEVLEMKDYEFKTIKNLNKGWFEVDGVKKRMKKEEAIAFDEARVAEAEAKKIEKLNKIANLIANKRNGKFSAKNPITIVEVKVVKGSDPEIGMTKKLSRHITVANMNKQSPKLIVINCCDCGAERTIKVQDQFQVKRCPECQKAHRNAMRRAKRAEKKAQLQVNQ